LAAKEQKDVEKMNRPGLTKFTARLKGNAEEKTAKEKRELEQALANVCGQCGRHGIPIYSRSELTRSIAVDGYCLATSLVVHQQKQKDANLVHQETMYSF
jgi:hypothetical protein